MIQTSASICAALDLVRVSSSIELLTSGMARGAFIRVATLHFPQTPLDLKELCFILSFFPAISPQYKLREEQCYWFCDVLMSTVRTAHKGASTIKEEEGFLRAGKFGKIAIPVAPTRRLFIDAYYIIRTLSQGLKLSVTLTRESVETFVSMLLVPSNEAKTLAVTALANLASRSLEHRRMVTEAGTAQKLLSIIPKAPMELKICILAALDAIIDKSFLRNPGSTHIDVLMNFLSLSLNPINKAYCKKAASMLCAITAEVDLSDDMCTTIKGAIPLLFPLLGNEDHDVRIIGTSGMAELAQHSGFTVILRFILTYSYLKPSCVQLWKRSSLSFLSYSRT
jgi:hypothetical protein